MEYAPSARAVEACSLWSRLPEAGQHAEAGASTSGWLSGWLSRGLSGLQKYGRRCECQVTYLSAVQITCLIHGVFFFLFPEPIQLIEPCRTQTSVGMMEG